MCRHFTLLGRLIWVLSYPSVWLYVCLHVSASIHPSVLPSVYPYDLSLCQDVYWYVCICVHPYICPLDIQNDIYVSVSTIFFMCPAVGCKPTVVYRIYLSLCPYLIERTSSYLITKIKQLLP